MKQTSIIATIAGHSHLTGTFIGSVGIDHHSGGYPYLNDYKLPENISNPEEYFFDRLLKARLTELSDGSQRFPCEASIFLPKYFTMIYGKKLESHPFDVKISFNIEEVEIDYSNIKNIRTTVKRCVLIEGIESSERKSFYKASVVPVD